MIGLHFLLLLNIIIFSSCLAQHNSSFVIAMAGNKGFAFKLIAVVEKIRSMKKGRSYAIVGFDLGFTEEERSLLTCSTPTLLSELRRFPFQRYPDHVKRLGCYAWKPLIIRELRSEGRGGIIWMDTAVGFQGPSPATARLDFLERALETAERFSGGVLSDRTQGELSRWTHPATFSYFEKTYGWSRERFEHGGVHNCNGGFSVWSFGTDKAVSERTNVAALALQQWSDCALKAECVCPGGSNRGNHRQDQAALTLVLGMHGVTCQGPPPGTAKERAATGCKDSPKQCRWAVTHRTKPQCRDAACVASKHKPACLSALPAAVVR